MGKTRLKEICDKIGSGATPRGGKESYQNEGTSLIRSQNVIDYGFIYDGLAHINEEQANKLSNVRVEADDLLLNITGDSVARACIVPSDVLPARVNQHVSIIRAMPNKVKSDYLLYFMEFNKRKLLKLAEAGATRNALTKGMIEDLEIDVPSMDMQCKITAILGIIDEKIRLNTVINENLAA